MGMSQQGRATDKGQRSGRTIHNEVRVTIDTGPAEVSQTPTKAIRLKIANYDWTTQCWKAPTRGRAEEERLE